MLAGLPYVVWPIGSLFIMVSRKKEDPFLYYHAWQALLAGGVMALGTLVLLLGLVISFRVMPGSSTYGSGFLGMGVVVAGSAVIVGILLTALFLGWRATEGEMLRIPFLGDFAEEKMLDQTGMTRRQFEAMLEASMHPEQREEEIPFPELQPGPVSRTTNKLEAAREARARSAQQRRPQPETERAPSPRSAAPVQRRPQQPAVAVRPSSQWEPLKPAQTQQQSQSVPVVKEVDLIGHYKEKKVEQGGKSDVLRQWLSSVDE